MNHNIFSTEKKRFMGALCELLCISLLLILYSIVNWFGSEALINLRSLLYLSSGLYFFSMGLHCLKLQRILGYLPHIELKSILAAVKRNKRLTRMTRAELEAKDEAVRSLEALPDEQRRFVEKCLVYCTCLTNPKTRQGMRFGIAAICCFVVDYLLHWGPAVLVIIGAICGLAALMRGGAGIVEDI